MAVSSGPTGSPTSSSLVSSPAHTGDPGDMNPTVVAVALDNVSFHLSLSLLAACELLGKANP